MPPACRHTVAHGSLLPHLGATERPLKGLRNACALMMPSPTRAIATSLLLAVFILLPPDLEPPASSTVTTRSDRWVSTDPDVSGGHPRGHHEADGATHPRHHVHPDQADVKILVALWKTTRKPTDPNPRPPASLSCYWDHHTRIAGTAILASHYTFLSAYR